jgi:hypothetical protein
MSFGTGSFGSGPFGSVAESAKVAFEAARATEAAVKAATELIRSVELMRAVEQAPPPPPATAERLACYLLPKRQRETILGDLEEDYRTTFLPKFGPQEARRMYWSQFIRSVAALMPGWIWAAAGGAIGWLWSKLSS